MHIDACRYFLYVGMIGLRLVFCRRVYMCILFWAKVVFDVLYVNHLGSRADVAMVQVHWTHMQMHLLACLIAAVGVFLLVARVQVCSCVCCTSLIDEISRSERIVWLCCLHAGLQARHDGVPGREHLQALHLQQGRMQEPGCVE
jgi:hypothetical protein